MSVNLLSEKEDGNTIRDFTKQEKQRYSGSYKGVVQNDSARILVYIPAFSISHQVPFRPITQELARRGHNVTVITTDPAFPIGQTPPNLTEIDVHDISYAFQTKIFSISAETGDLVSQNEAFYYIYNHVFDVQLKNENVKRVIDPKRNEYDLLLLESCFRNTLALSHVFKVPVIQFSSSGIAPESSIFVGAAVNPILYPKGVYQKKVHNHNIWDKISTLYREYAASSISRRYEELDLKMLRSHFDEDLPGWKELGDNVDMLFLNVHPIWDNNRPVPPNVVYLGGLPQKPYRELPKDLKSYLDSSKNGVIYISFGTNVDPSLLPKETVQIFQKVLSKLPYDVLWKWNPGVMEGKPKNVRVGKYFPQSDLLKHPKIKLFITQGGLQSTDEAIVAGVPLLGIPMLADQWFNTDHYVKHGIGKQIELFEIGEENLMEAIKTVVQDPTYRKNVVKLRSIMYNQPTTALERAIYWIEHVLEHGGARHLRAEGANLSIREYYELDLVVTLVALMVLTTVGNSCLLDFEMLKVFRENEIKEGLIYLPQK